MTSTLPAILITGADLAPQALELLGDFNVIYAGARPSEEDLVRLVQTHDPVGIIVRYGRITPKIIDAAQTLKVIAKHGSGLDTIDVEYARRRGIAVRAAVGANAVAVAEHALTLMLACAKSLIELDRSMQQGQWIKSTHKSLELKGRTLGLVGLGAIGRLVAQFAQVLGMKVIAHDPYVQSCPDGITAVDLETLWRQADVISLHCPLTADNRNLINASTVAAMRDGVILINTARGGLIDEQALIDGLASGKIFAAGIDSFREEPPSAQHPFVGHPRLILTPHVAGVSQQAYINMGVQAATELVKVLLESSFKV